MRTRLLLIGAALVAFGASLASGFHFDDYAIFSDPSLTSAGGLAQLWSLRQTRPLTYLTFWFNYQIGGGDALGYHIVNLALHIGAVLLAYECLRRLLPATTAAIAAGIFAVHPIQAEAVDYVWGRSIVLATLLCLCALDAWLDDKPWLAVAWFAAALLAKEEVAAFPLALLLLDRKRPYPIAAMLVLSLAAGARVVYATAVTLGAPAGFQAGITPWHYFLTQGEVILRYLRLLIVPYGFTVDPDVSPAPVWLGLLSWAMVGVIAFAAWRYSKWFLAGLILLIPSSTVFPAADLAADRRVYFPLLMFAAAAASLLVQKLARKEAGIAIVVVLTMIGVGRTYVWMSDQRVWQEAVDRAPGKVRPKIQLARSLPAAAALELLGKARVQAPNDPAIAAETGRILLAEGQPDAALPEFGRALALDPRDARNLNNRGVALEQLGQTDAARADFRRALEIDPNLTEARQNLQKLAQ